MDILEVFPGRSRADGWRRTLVVGAVSALAVSGLAGGALASASSARAAPAAVATPFSYVANFHDNSITEYARNADDNVAPVATISGSSTGLNEPSQLTFGPSGQLFVANSGGNSITEYAPGATGNVKPIATISGTDTGLDAPLGVTFDRSGELFVTNISGNSVTGYAAGATGNVKPKATISGANTALHSPWGLVFDGSGDLFVSNDSSPNEINEFGPGAVGNVAPMATITGGNTGLAGPEGLTVDRSGNLIVANATGNSITEYAPGTTGNMFPLATISGTDTKLISPNAVALDQSGNLFVTNSGGTQATSFVTTYKPGAHGDAPPIATISGSNTGLDDPEGIVVAPAQVPVVASAQFGIPNQTDVFRVGPNGAVEVRWVQGGGTWHGPLDISSPGVAPPGTHLAVSQQFGIANQTDVFVVGDNGAIDVFWVQGGGPWHGPLAITPAGSSTPGAGLTASQQFGIGNQTDVWVVGDNAAIDVSWVQGAGAWHAPLAITPAGSSTPGSALTSSQQFGIPNQTDVWVVGNNAAIDVSSVAGAGPWQGPLGITPPGFAFPGSALTSSQQFGIPNQTDVWVVGNNAAIDLSWVQGAGAWNGPVPLTPAGSSTPGSALTSSQQFGIPNQTDVWVVGNNAAIDLSWVQGAGTWKGPMVISPASFFFGAPLASSPQFGIPNQTDVWVVDETGTIDVFWVQDGGAWKGPLPI